MITCVQNEGPQVKDPRVNCDVIPDQEERSGFFFSFSFYGTRSAATERWDPGSPAGRGALRSAGDRGANPYLFGL